MGLANVSMDVPPKLLLARQDFTIVIGLSIARSDHRVKTFSLGMKLMIDVVQNLSCARWELSNPRHGLLSNMSGLEG